MPLIRPPATVSPTEGEGTFTKYSNLTLPARSILTEIVVARTRL
jgi:hypothetical protein